MLSTLKYSQEVLLEIVTQVHQTQNAQFLHHMQ